MKKYSQFIEFMQAADPSSPDVYPVISRALMQQPVIAHLLKHYAPQSYHQRYLRSRTTFLSHQPTRQLDDVHAMNQNEDVLNARKASQKRIELMLEEKKISRNELQKNRKKYLINIHDEFLSRVEKYHNKWGGSEKLIEFRSDFEAFISYCFYTESSSTYFSIICSYWNASSVQDFSEREQRFDHFFHLMNECRIAYRDQKTKYVTADKPYAQGKHRDWSCPIGCDERFLDDFYVTTIQASHDPTAKSETCLVSEYCQSLVHWAVNSQKMPSQELLSIIYHAVCESLGLEAVKPNTLYSLKWKNELHDRAAHQVHEKISQLLSLTQSQSLHQLIEFFIERHNDVSAQFKHSLQKIIDHDSLESFIHHVTNMKSSSFSDCWELHQHSKLMEFILTQESAQAGGFHEIFIKIGYQELKHREFTYKELKFLSDVFQDESATSLKIRQNITECVSKSVRIFEELLLDKECGLLNQEESHEFSSREECLSYCHFKKLIPDQDIELIEKSNHGVFELIEPDSREPVLSLNHEQILKIREHLSKAFGIQPQWLKLLDEIFSEHLPNWIQSCYYQILSMPLNFETRGNVFHNQQARLNNLGKIGAQWMNHASPFDFTLWHYVIDRQLQDLLSQRLVHAISTIPINLVEDWLKTDDLLPCDQDFLDIEEMSELLEKSLSFFKTRLLFRILNQAHSLHSFMNIFRLFTISEEIFGEQFIQKQLEKLSGYLPPSNNINFLMFLGGHVSPTILKIWIKTANNSDLLLSKIIELITTNVELQNRIAVRNLLRAYSEQMIARNDAAALESFKQEISQHLLNQIHPVSTHLRSELQQDLLKLGIFSKKEIAPLVKQAIPYQADWFLNIVIDHTLLDQKELARLFFNADPDHLREIPSSLIAKMVSILFSQKNYRKAIINQISDEDHQSHGLCTLIAIVNDPLFYEYFSPDDSTGCLDFSSSYLKILKKIVTHLSMMRDFSIPFPLLSEQQLTELKTCMEHLISPEYLKQNITAQVLSYFFGGLLEYDSSVCPIQHLKDISSCIQSLKNQDSGNRKVYQAIYHDYLQNFTSFFSSIYQKAASSAPDQALKARCFYMYFTEFFPRAIHSFEMNTSAFKAQVNDKLNLIQCDVTFLKNLCDCVMRNPNQSKAISIFIEALLQSPIQKEFHHVWNHLFLNRLQHANLSEITILNSIVTAIHFIDPSGLLKTLTQKIQSDLRQKELIEKTLQISTASSEQKQLMQLFLLIASYLYQKNPQDKMAFENAFYSSVNTPDMQALKHRIIVSLIIDSAEIHPLSEMVVLSELLSLSEYIDILTLFFQKDSRVATDFFEMTIAYRMNLSDPLTHPSVLHAIIDHAISSLCANLVIAIRSKFQMQAINQCISDTICQKIESIDPATPSPNHPLSRQNCGEIRLLQLAFQIFGDDFYFHRILDSIFQKMPSYRAVLQAFGIQDHALLHLIANKKIEMIVDYEDLIQDLSYLQIPLTQVLQFIAPLHTTLTGLENEESQLDTLIQVMLFYRTDLEALIHHGFRRYGTQFPKAVFEAIKAVIEKLDTDLQSAPSFFTYRSICRTTSLFSANLVIIFHYLPDLKIQFSLTNRLEIALELYKRLRATSIFEKFFQETTLTVNDYLSFLEILSPDLRKSFHQHFQNWMMSLPFTSKEDKRSTPADRMLGIFSKYDFLHDSSMICLLRSGFSEQDFFDYFLNQIISLKSQISTDPHSIIVFTKQLAFLLKSYDSTLSRSDQIAILTESEKTIPILILFGMMESEISSQLSFYYYSLSIQTMNDFFKKIRLLCVYEKNLHLNGLTLLDHSDLLKPLIQILQKFGSQFENQPSFYPCWFKILEEYPRTIFHIGMHTLSKIESTASFQKNQNTFSLKQFKNRIKMISSIHDAFEFVWLLMCYEKIHLPTLHQCLKRIMSTDQSIYLLAAAEKMKSPIRMILAQEYWNSRDRLHSTYQYQQSECPNQIVEGVSTLLMDLSADFLLIQTEQIILPLKDYEVPLLNQSYEKRILEWIQTTPIQHQSWEIAGINFPDPLAFLVNVLQKAQQYSISLSEAAFSEFLNKAEPGSFNAPVEKYFYLFERIFDLFGIDGCRRFYQKSFEILRVLSFEYPESEMHAHPNILLVHQLIEYKKPSLLPIAFELDRTLLQHLLNPNESGVFSSNQLMYCYLFMINQMKHHDPENLISHVMSAFESNFLKNDVKKILRAIELCCKYQLANTTQAMANHITTSTELTYLDIFSSLDIQDEAIIAFIFNHLVLKKDLSFLMQIILLKKQTIIKQLTLQWANRSDSPQEIYQQLKIALETLIRSLPLSDQDVYYSFKKHNIRISSNAEMMQNLIIGARHLQRQDFHDILNQLYEKMGLTLLIEYSVILQDHELFQTLMDSFTPKDHNYSLWFWTVVEAFSDHSTLIFFNWMKSRETDKTLDPSLRSTETGFNHLLLDGWLEHNKQCAKLKKIFEHNPDLVNSCLNKLWRNGVSLLSVKRDFSTFIKECSLGHFLNPDTLETFINLTQELFLKIFYMIFYEMPHITIPTISKISPIDTFIDATTYLPDQQILSKIAEKLQIVEHLSKNTTPRGNKNSWRALIHGGFMIGEIDILKYCLRHQKPFTLKEYDSLIEKTVVSEPTEHDLFKLLELIESLNEISDFDRYYTKIKDTLINHSPESWKLFIDTCRKSGRFWPQLDRDIFKESSDDQSDTETIFKRRKALVFQERKSSIEEESIELKDSKGSKL